jgi:hypothetical protein
MAGKNKTLADYNSTWKAFLESEKCPPVLGLAPLSSDEADEIRALVQAQLAIHPNHRLNRLVALLKLYPAVMTVWLARVAGEAYDGNFWENYTRLIGVDFNASARPEFVRVFRQCCFLAGITTLDPPQLGAFMYVERLLFQAGLPLCHVGSFSRSMRWVEQQYSLPDPDAPEAGQDLRAFMERSPYLGNIPILRKALAGPAGPLICEVALRVALDARPLEINPALARAIEEAFEDVGPATTDRPRAPFLRLAADFSSLEIVCPKQAASLVGPTGLLWVIAGVAQRVGANDETVFPVPSEGHFMVELRGLAGELNLRREFDLRWSELKQPFLVFDNMTRCWHRVEEGEVIALRSGQYWVLHPVESQFDANARRWEWPDGQSALSEITLLPNLQLRLNANGKVCVFKTAQVPFFSPHGKIITTDEMERIHYGWTKLPEIWCPAADEPGGSSDWKLFFHSGDQSFVVPLNNGEHNGDMVSFRPEADQFLMSLAPGLHFVQLAVSRGARRPLCKETFQLWVGLREYRPGIAFDFDVVPSNMRWADCLGLLLDGTTLKHSNDNRRQHAVSFDIGEDVVTFHFSRSGTFLESFDKRAGHVIQAEPCMLDSTFSASIQSTEYLRIWRIPCDDYELLVNGKPVQQVARESGRLFCDLSLANLSTRFTKAGEIAIRLHGNPFNIARFARPLVPIFANFQSDETYESLVFKFTDEVAWVRPRLRELVSGKRNDFVGQKFTSSGHCTFSSDGLPTVESANVSSDIKAETSLYRVSLDVPKHGWPEGIWLMELEIRRDETSAWQLLSDEKGGGFPLVVIVRPGKVPTDLRAMAFWWAFSHGQHGGLIPAIMPLSPAMETMVCELTTEISALLSRGYNDFSWQRLSGLERLFFELGRLIARRLKSSEVLVRDLIQAAGRECISNSARSLFVIIPELLTQSAEAYAGMPDTDGLRDALRWCARTRSHSRVAEGFMDAMEQVIASPSGTIPGIFSVLRDFANSTEIMQPRSDGGQAPDFRQFNFAHYRDHTVGSITEYHIEQSAWIEPSPFDKLCRNHALSALHALRKRRQSDNGHIANQANTVFSNATELRLWMQSQLGRRASFVSQNTWISPWLEVDFSDDALAGNLNCYASMAALAARASAAGWMRYSEFLLWQTNQYGLEMSMKATTTLVAMSPELFGLYLLLWELLICTQPHD